MHALLRIFEAQELHRLIRGLDGARGMGFKDARQARCVGFAVADEALIRLLELMPRGDPHAGDEQQRKKAYRKRQPVFGYALDTCHN
jgi:hypothetical protein